MINIDNSIMSSVSQFQSDRGVDHDDEEQSSSPAPHRKLSKPAEKQAPTPRTVKVDKGESQPRSPRSEKSGTYQQSPSSQPLPGAFSVMGPPSFSSDGGPLRVFKDSESSSYIVSRASATKEPPPISFQKVSFLGADVSVASVGRSIGSSTILGASEAPKLRPQTVVYVNGADLPIDRRRTRDNVPETRLTSQPSAETEVSVPVSAELVDNFDYLYDAEGQVIRARILNNQRSKVRAFLMQYWWLLAIFLLLSVGISVGVAVMIVHLSDL